MRGYYTVLDCSDILKILDIEEKTSLRFFCHLHIRLNISPDDSGFLNTKLKEDSNFENAIIKTHWLKYHLDLFKNFPYGKIQTLYELSNISTFYKRQKKYPEWDSNLYNIFEEQIDREDIFVSSEALVPYFIETLSEFDGEIVDGQCFYTSGEEYFYILLKLNLDDNLIETILNKENCFRFEDLSTN